MNQQEEDRLTNQPTSGTSVFRKIIVDSIVHEKNANGSSIKWYLSISLNMKRNKSMIKTVLRTYLQQEGIPLTGLEPNIEYRLCLTI